MRRLWLLGLGLVFLALVGALAYVELGQPATSPQMSRGGGGMTACRALRLAAASATQWQADARPVAVSGQRLAVGRQPEAEVEWAFQFFSPSTQRLALIVVDGGAARLVRESLSPYVVTTFAADELRVDSDQAWQTWWNRGGGSVVARRPDVDVLMQVRVPDAGGHPLWTVAGVVAGTNSAFVVQIDATDGTPVGP